MHEVAPEAKKQWLALETSRKQLAAATAVAFSTGQWDELASKTGLEYERQIYTGTDRLDRLRTEPWRRWAGGFSCLAFIMIGAPLAIIVRSADPWTTFGMCFLPILLLYYPLFLYGLDASKDGTLPPYSVWLGNIVLMMVSGLIVRRVWRY